MNNLIDAIKTNIASILSIRDTIGLKRADVYFASIENETASWKQILPTPNVQIDSNIQQTAGGVINRNNLVLRGIPQANYTLANLETSSEDGTVEKYWVIEGLAYTTDRIIKNLTTYDVYISRYEQINLNELGDPVL